MAGCCKNCLLSLGLTDQQRIAFTTSEFPGLNPYIFSVYRFVVTLYFIVFTVWYSASSEEYGWTFLIYLTNLTLLLVTLYLVVASLNSAWFLIRRHHIDDATSSRENALPFIHKLHWVLYYMAAGGSLLVMVLYWGAIYTPDTSVGLFTDLNVHALTTLAMVVETLVSAIQVRLRHVIYPVAYGVFYSLLTVIFWAAGGTDIKGNPYIYSIIDYETDAVFATVVVVGALIGTAVCHVVIWLFFKLRMKIVTKWFDVDNAESEMIATTGV